MPREDPTTEDRSSSVTIRVVGAPLRVASGSTLLEALASTTRDRLRERNYCWEGECAHCEATVRDRGETPRSVLACLLRVTDGLEVAAVSRYLEVDLAR